MLIDVLALPPSRYGPVDRRYRTCSDKVFHDHHLNPFGPDHLSFQAPDLVLGNHIKSLPRMQYKAVYSSPENQTVFEVVYAMDLSGCHCLYVKTLSNEVDVMIPAATIRRHIAGTNNTFTLGELLSESYYHTSAPLLFSASVPPVFSEKSLKEETHLLISTVEERFTPDRLQQLYHHEPVILGAVLRGTFLKAPHTTLHNPLPYVPLNNPRWSLLEEEDFNNHVSPGRSYFNHPRFDDIVIDLLWLRPTEIKYSILMGHAVDGFTTLGVTNHLRDAYQYTLPDVPNYLPRIHERLSEVLKDCMDAYCELFNYDKLVFSKSAEMDSVLVIEKNIYDEVTISFKDVINNRYTRFYTSFPTIALATWGMGTGA